MIFRLLASIVCKIILFCSGWKTSVTKSIKHLNSIDNAIIIYPHSSYFDYVFYSLYYYAYNLTDIYTIMSERFIPFPKLCPSLVPAPDYNVRHYMDKGVSRLKAIYYAWRDKFRGQEIEQKYNKTNFVNYLTDHFKDRKYKILISPTGSITSQKWKSGYYHLSKNLNVPIVVCGVDYEKKDLVVSNIFQADDLHPSRNDLNSVFAHISTYHNTKHINIFNYGCIANVFFYLLNNLLLCRASLFYIVWNLFGFFATHNYYITKNAIPIFYNLHKILISIAALNYAVNYKVGSLLILMSIISLVVGCSCIGYISKYYHKSTKSHLILEFMIGLGVFNLMR
jgi:hypothetical protein